MPAETDEIVDVCIVGAGMAGLVVAAETAAAGLRTVVVDASDRVGGMLAPVMIAGLMLILGERSWLTILLTSTVPVAVVYLVVTYVLRAPLP